MCGVRRVAGNTLGWISSFFYLISRVSQIYKNWQRRATEGLSLSMFACTIVANLLYGVSILLRATCWADIYLSAPWLLGSLGTVGMDITIFLQVRGLLLRFVSGRGVRRGGGQKVVRRRMDRCVQLR